MYSDLKYLLCPLPEDIAKLKWSGDFARAKRVIDKRIAKGVPTALEKRLLLEKDILDRMPVQYPFSYEQALEELKKAFADFQEEELEQLWEEDAAEWIFIEGKPYFKDDIVANLVKTRPALAKRVNNPSFLTDKEGNFSLLDETIAKMKKNGSLAYRIHVKNSLKVAPEFEKPGETLRVHLPIPVEYAQVKNFQLLNTSHTPKVVADSQYPNRTVYFEEKLKADEEFFVEYAFENHVRYVDPKPEDVADGQPTFYTEEYAPQIVFTPYIRELAAQIVGEEKNPLVKARKIYDFITTKVMYSFVRSYFTIPNIPEYGASGLKGDCGIQALLFITLCRCCGVPARWQSGLYANPRSIGNHDWAQFYVAPYGWMFADCSFGGAAWREGALERWNFYFGNLEPFRIPACSDFQHELYPAKKFLRNDPYDNQSGEAEYEDQGLRDVQLISEYKVVEAKEMD